LIPLRDSTPNRTVPFVNYAIIALTTAVFGWELNAGQSLETVIEAHALIPDRFLALGDRYGFFQLDLYQPFVSSLFLHAGFSHFGFNMLFLWVFGDNVEDRFGHLGYLGFYLVGGTFAGAAHVAANAASTVPTIGASGAIAAVMGAYFLLYPRAWITSVVLPLFFLQFKVPALFYLAFWFGLQLYWATAEQGGSMVAWWAHTGGFVFGFATIVFCGRQRPDAAS